MCLSVYLNVWVHVPQCVGVWPCNKYIIYKKGFLICPHAGRILVKGNLQQNPLTVHVMKRGEGESNEKGRRGKKYKYI